MKQTRGKQSKTKARIEGDPAHDTTPVYPAADAPVVVVYKSKQTKKRGSSKAARRLEDIEERVSKSVHRVSKAVNKGVATYIDQRDKSARKRRDGAIVDAYQNVAVGVSQALAESTPVLTDIAKAVNTRRLRRRIRRAVRRIPVIG